MPVSLREILPLALLLAGCPSPDEPAALIGSGEIEWESLDDGEAQVIQGPQGGFHLLASVRVTGIETGDPGDLLNANNPTAQFDVVLGGDSMLLTGDFTQGLERTPAGTDGWTHEVVGRFAILDIEDDDELHGETVTFSVSVEDVNGVTVTDSIELDLERHPLNP